MRPACLNESTRDLVFDSLRSMVTGGGAALGAGRGGAGTVFLVCFWRRRTRELVRRRLGSSNWWRPRPSRFRSEPSCNKSKKSVINLRRQTDKFYFHHFCAVYQDNLVLSQIQSLRSESIDTLNQNNEKAGVFVRRVNWSKRLSPLSLFTYAREHIMFPNFTAAMRFKIAESSAYRWTDAGVVRMTTTA